MKSIPSRTTVLARIVGRTLPGDYLLHCLASSVDWYGNARPLFLRGRIFALLGYEIVEGGIENGHFESYAELATRHRLNERPLPSPLHSAEEAIS